MISMHRVVLCCWKSVLAVTSPFCWQNSVNLCLSSFFIPRPNLSVTPVISWFPTFAFQFPIMKRISFLVLVLEGLIGLLRTVQLQLLWHFGLGHRFGLLWYWKVCLGDEHKSFCHFWGCTKYCILDSFFDYVPESSSSSQGFNLKGWVVSVRNWGSLSFYLDCLFISSLWFSFIHLQKH